MFCPGSCSLIRSSLESLKYTSKPLTLQLFHGYVVSSWTFRVTRCSRITHYVDVADVTYSRKVPYHPPTALNPIKDFSGGYWAFKRNAHLYTCTVDFVAA